ncbi:MAG: hypothetical protein JHC26_05215 [Thermofilum sp.]|jgi:hypothetical protein|uniref:hypothetical protein n=1 Tax=Thermofilum sp. TaxID=1961369 RepID=UPI0025861C94|nr:hypothetical protein [Thermofilum sp.]MCI4408470.1 hypothetical protein [Thermofilum sp.]
MTEKEAKLEAKQDPKTEEKTGEKKEKEKKKREKKPSDFSNEYLGKNVTIVLGAGNPNILKCKVESASKYWFKVTIGNRTLYLNKAYVVSIEA